MEKHRGYCFDCHAEFETDDTSKPCLNCGSENWVLWSQFRLWVGEVRGRSHKMASISISEMVISSNSAIDSAPPKTSHVNPPTRGGHRSLIYSDLFELSRVLRRGNVG